MLTIIIEILLAVFWTTMLIIIIHENKGNGDEGEDHVGLWIVIGIFAVLGIIFS